MLTVKNFSTNFCYFGGSNAFVVGPGVIVDLPISYGECFTSGPVVGTVAVTNGQMDIGGQGVEWSDAHGTAVLACVIGAFCVGAFASVFKSILGAARGVLGGDACVDGRIE